jgi:ADP-dependent NAD(P)H-hydrate dehydratase / NAD(P)H-hydrate epimerase
MNTALTAFVTAQQMRDCEAQLFATGISPDALITRAGTTVAQVILHRFPNQQKVLVLAGPGNNGADALVVAAQLAQQGRQVTVLCWRRAPDAWHTRAVAVGVQMVAAWDEIWLAQACRSHELIVDGLLGLGSNRPLSGDVLTIVQAINQRPPHVSCVAIDLPSGCLADSGALLGTVVRADLTIATGPRKIGLSQLPAMDMAGDVVSVDIRVATDHLPYHELTTAWAQAHRPARPRDSYKGTYGTLNVWAGSAQFPGAAYLASAAAARVGTGIVSLATTSALAPLLWRLPESTLTLLNGDVSHDCVALTDARFTALLIGPGLGRSDAVAELLWAVLAPQSIGDRTALLDADALALLGRDPHWYTRLTPQRYVLTPHLGELRRLCGGTLPDLLPHQIATYCATTWQQVVVMKGSTTLIAHPDGRLLVWPHPNPALATAGSGDILAGIIAGLLTQGISPWAAAGVGVYIQGHVAQILRGQHGDAGTLASDALPLIPHALKSLQ